MQKLKEAGITPSVPGEGTAAAESQFPQREAAALNTPANPFPVPGLSEALLELCCYIFLDLYGQAILQAPVLFLKTCTCPFGALFSF